MVVFSDSRLSHHYSEGPVGEDQLEVHLKAVQMRLEENNKSHKSTKSQCQEERSSSEEALSITSSVEPTSFYSQMTQLSFSGPSNSKKVPFGGFLAAATVDGTVYVWPQNLTAAELLGANVRRWQKLFGTACYRTLIGTAMSHFLF